MNIQRTFIPPVGIQRTKTPSPSGHKTDFSDHLKEAVKGERHALSISKHAKIRLEQRNIKITEEHWERISEKVKEAKGMGVNESLVLLKDAALIVSAKNETVITAMDRQEATSQIFTNINGTIIIDH